MWPEGMPQPPEGLHWEVAKSTGRYVRVSLVSKWGRTRGQGILTLPVGSQVGDVDSEVISAARFALREYDRKHNTGLADAQLVRIKGYGKWED